MHETRASAFVSFRLDPREAVTILSRSLDDKDARHVADVGSDASGAPA